MISELRRELRRALDGGDRREVLHLLKRTPGLLDDNEGPSPDLSRLEVDLSAPDDYRKKYAESFFGHCFITWPAGMKEAYPLVYEDVEVGIVFVWPRNLLLHGFDSQRYGVAILPHSLAFLNDDPENLGPGWGKTVKWQSRWRERSISVDITLPTHLLNQGRRKEMRDHVRESVKDMLPKHAVLTINRGSHATLWVYIRQGNVYRFDSDIEYTVEARRLHEKLKRWLEIHTPWSFSKRPYFDFSPSTTWRI